MRECKHRWAIRNGSPALLGDLDSKSQEVFCLKCGKTVNDLLYEKERQLEAAANDSIKFIRCFNCPMERVNGLKCVSLDCKELWRKRWEDKANDR